MFRIEIVTHTNCKFCIVLYVYRVTLVGTLTLAPFSSSRAAMSLCPSWEARWSGVTPCLVSMLVSAPYCSRVVAISIWFFFAAMWRGVYPFCKMENMEIELETETWAMFVMSEHQCQTVAESIWHHHPTLSKMPMMVLSLTLAVAWGEAPLSKSSRATFWLS